MTANDWVWVAVCAAWAAIGGWFVGWLIATLEKPEQPNDQT